MCNVCCDKLQMQDEVALMPSIHMKTGVHWTWRHLIASKITIVVNMGKNEFVAVYWTHLPHMSQGKRDRVIGIALRHV